MEVHEPNDPADGAAAVGSVFEGKYRVERLLGRGGMGQVYEATHLLLDKRVAVKVLLPRYAADQEMVARVIREARAASAIGHPNIVAVTDMGWTGDRPFMVMELLRGESMAERIRAEGGVGLVRALDWMCQVLDALEAVHGQGIVHRDLKPANVMLVPGREGQIVVKILDFGISKVQREVGEQASQGHTRTGQILGTPNHMSPEQARALPGVDHRADIHAAGSLLYTLLCGDAPFQGPTITATLARLLEGSYVRASERVPGLPPAVDAVIARALAGDPQERYPAAASMREALTRLQHHDPSQSPEVGPAGAGPPGVDSVAVMPGFESILPAGGTPQVAPVGGITALAEAPEPHEPAAPAASGFTALELDVPPGWKPGQSDPVTHVARKPSVNLGWWLTVAGLAAVVVAGWVYRDELRTLGADAAASEGEGGEMILLLIDTVPRDAIVFVDDVQRDERPIEVPRSSTPLKIRVEAKRYETRVLQVEPSATRRVKISLDRAR